MSSAHKLALLALVVVITLIALTSDEALHSTRRIFLFSAVALVALCGAVVLPDLRQGPAAVFNAKLFGFAGILVFLVLGMLKSVFIYDEPTTLDTWTAVRASFVVGTVVAGFWLGGLLGVQPGRLGPFSRGRISSSRLLFFTLLLAFIGGMVTLLFNSPFRPFDTTISNHLRVFSGCMAPAGALAIWQLLMVRPRTPARRWVFYLALLPLPLLAIPSTSRVPLAFIVSFAFVAYVYRIWVTRPQRFPYGRIAVLVGITVLFMFSAAAVVDVLADRHWTVGDDESAVVSDARFRFTHVTSVDAFDNLIRTIELYPDQNRYLYGWSVAALVVNPIPRSMWPDKPYGFGRLLAEETDVRYFEGMSLAPSLAGELVANFGFVGPFLGYVLLGVGAASLYKRFLSAPSGSPYHLLYLAALIIFLLESRGDLLVINVRVGWYLFCMYLALRLSTVDVPVTSLAQPRNRRAWLPSPAPL